MEFRIPYLQKHPRFWGAIFFAILLLVYSLIFLANEAGTGEGISVLSILPMLVIAWFFGLRGAAAGSLLIILLNVALFLLTRRDTLVQDMDHGGLIGMLALVLVGFSVGWARVVYNRAKTSLLERSKVETALRESEQKNRLIFENMTQGMALDQLLLDESGVVVDWLVLDVNPAYEKIMRLARAEVVGRTGSQLYANYRDMLPLFNQVSAKKLEEKEGTNPSLTHNALRIRDREIKMTASWLHDQQVSVLITDMSEENRMFEAERRQRRLAEALRDISEALTSTLQVEGVLDRIIIHIQKIVSFDAMNIMLLDHGRVRAVRHQGYVERGLKAYIDGFDRSLEDVPGMKWMIEHARPLVFPDTEQAEAWVAFPPTAWIRSFAGIPISRRGEIIGFLNLNSATPGFFQADFIDQLQPFADQAALAIENARAYENIQQSARRMALLNRASSLLNRPVEFRTILQVTVDCFSDAFNLDEIYVALFMDNSRLVVVACRTNGLGNINSGAEIALAANPAAAYVLANKTPLLVQNGNSQPEVSGVREMMQQQHVAALLLLPLIIGDQLIGMVGCHFQRPKRYFSEEEVDLGSSIANLAAVRIEQARIFDEERKQVSSLALLHATSLDISRSHNNPDLLKTIVRRAVWLLNASGGTLYLCNPQRGELLCKVSHNFSHNEEGLVSRYGEGASGRVAQSGKALLIDDYARWEHTTLTAAEMGESFCLLTVPVIFNEVVTGVLQIFRGDRHNNFSAQDTELLSLYSNQVAIALENARLYEEIQQVAIHDSLTGLYNRRGLFDVAEREISRALRYQRSLAVCLLDIDHFKQVNDTYGHPVGDEVLARLAQHIRQNLRSIDVLGRYGGEEFIILAVENDREAAGGLAQRICHLISARPIPTSVGGVSVTVSIGVSALSEAIHDLPGLLQAADQALYEAKHSGRNQVKIYTEAPVVENG